MATNTNHFEKPNNLIDSVRDDIPEIWSPKGNRKAISKIERMKRWQSGSSAHRTSCAHLRMPQSHTHRESFSGSGTGREQQSHRNRAKRRTDCDPHQNEHQDWKIVFHDPAANIQFLAKQRVFGHCPSLVPTARLLELAQLAPLPLKIACSPISPRRHFVSFSHRGPHSRKRIATLLRYLFCLEPQSQAPPAHRHPPAQAAKQAEIVPFLASHCQSFWLCWNQYKPIPN